MLCFLSFPFACTAWVDAWQACIPLRRATVFCLRLALQVLWTPPRHPPHVRPPHAIQQGTQLAIGQDCFGRCAPSSVSLVAACHLLTCSNTPGRNSSPRCRWTLSLRARLVLQVEACRNRRGVGEVIAPACCARHEWYRVPSSLPQRSMKNNLNTHMARCSPAWLPQPSLAASAQLGCLSSAGHTARAHSCAQPPPPSEHAALEPPARHSGSAEHLRSAPALDSQAFRLATTCTRTAFWVPLKAAPYASASGPQPLPQRLVLPSVAAAHAGLRRGVGYEEEGTRQRQHEGATAIDEERAMLGCGAAGRGRAGQKERTQAVRKDSPG